MKILYAIQGTGNGHISRAREIVPLLQKHGEVDLLISGTQADVKLSQDIAYQLHGFSFIFGKKGGVNHYETWKSMNLTRFIKDMRKLPLKDYNLILNDFEPVTAWACKLKGIESVGLSHQASFQSPRVPKIKSVNWAQLVMKYYAPATHYVGFHFKPYDDFIHTPVIRSEIRNLQTSNLGHYTVYLPAIDDQILVPILKQVPEVKWQIFSKHSKKSFTDQNVSVCPVNNEKFNISLASCEGLFTGGGFEGPSEALFLGKKLLVVPMKFQYEQQCNAYALEEMGLPVIWGNTKNWLPVIRAWVSNPQQHEFHFRDETAELIEKVVNQFAR
ncbi:glycosyltransferase family protein [Pedobacter sp. AW31-3R]|uniref:glycosyltransferase family protein n=1 Tax=Pedobacter sp. AW31-3R TaxID=3445781 RepID=UPI003F9FAA46